MIFSQSIFRVARTCPPALKLALSVALGMVVLSSSALAQEKQSAVLYEASKVYTMDGDPLEPGQVLVVDGKIRSVGKTVDASGLTVERVSLGDGSVLMPGLVDAHSQTPLDPNGVDEITSEVTLDFRAIDSVDWDNRLLKRQLHAGTTTVNACPGTQNVVGGTSAIVKTMDHGEVVLNDDGAMVAAMCNDPAARNRARARPDSIYIRQPTNRMGVVWILRNTFNKAARSDDDTFMKLREVLEDKRPLMMVSRMSYDVATVGTLADEFGFNPIIVGGHEAYKVKDDLVERKYPVVLKYDSPGSTRGAEGSELCWNQPGVLHEAGITFAIGGDNLLEKARFARRFGLENDVALAAVTSTPAKLLSLQDRVGKIAEGFDADMIALSGEPLDFTTSIRWVMVNGKTTENQKGK